MYLQRGTEAFESVVSTLYHEMGHATDMTKMPAMYAYVASADEITPAVFATFLFLEYVAEQRTADLSIGEYPIFCDQIATGLFWNRYGKEDPYTAFLRMSKYLVYFIVKVDVLKKREYYLDKTKDSLFTEYANALGKALETVYVRLPFDDYKLCGEIEAVMNRFMLAFKDKYSPEK